MAQLNIPWRVIDSSAPYAVPITLLALCLILNVANLLLQAYLWKVDRLYAATVVNGALGSVVMSLARVHLYWKRACLRTYPYQIGICAARRALHKSTVACGEWHCASERLYFVHHHPLALWKRRLLKQIKFLAHLQAIEYSRLPDRCSVVFRCVRGILENKCQFVQDVPSSCNPGVLQRMRISCNMRLRPSVI